MNFTIAHARLPGVSFHFETPFDYAKRKDELRAIEDEMSAPEFWTKQEKAQVRVARLKTVKGVVEPLEKCLSDEADLKALIEMAEEDDDAIADVRALIDSLEERLDALELKSLLTGAHDSSNALMTIHARDGGTDANDWAEMLLRMYSYWADKHGYSIELLDREENLEAGINNATIAIRGPMAYGYLRGETGMHRLVRISPFNAEAKRQTSFAAVDVTPEIEDDTEIEIEREDYREDVFRASGAGGQHVNKTSSAIRMTHLETGIVVQCQNERSQHKNRATALKMLYSALVRRQDDQREAEQAEAYQNKARTGFGSQIRSYFQHPDQRVKDARTGYYAGNFNGVLDGDIQGFLDAVLKWRVGQDVNSGEPESSKNSD